MKTYSAYQENINEGFWSWLGKLLKSIFDPDTTEETKTYTEKALKNIEDINKDLNKPTTELLGHIKDNKPEEFLKGLDETIKSLKEDKLLNDEDAIKYELTVLSIAIRISNDSKKNDVVKTLKERFDEVAKKNQDLAKELSKDIKTEEVPDKPGEKEPDKENPEGEEGKGKDNDEEPNKDEINKIYKDHKSIIDEMCKSNKVEASPDYVEKKTNEYCETNKIEDPNIYYGLYLLKFADEMSVNKDYVSNVKKYLRGK